MTIQRRYRSRTSCIGEEERRPRLLVANPAADLYGSDRMLLETVAGAVERGWQVDAALGEPGPLAEELIDVGAQVHVVAAPVLRKADIRPAGLFKLAWRTAAGSRALLNLLRTTRPDVLYVNTVTMPWWLVMARATCVPSVVHVHEAEASLPLLARLGLTVPLLLADRVVFNSRTSRAVAVATPWCRPLTESPVVLNGLDAPAAVPARTELSDGPRLLFVGRLSPRKGVDVAVEALRLLRQRGIPAHLDIVGAVFPGYEWYETELRGAVAADNLERHVTFHGYRDDAAALRARTDIALVPSRLDESFGNVVVESLFAARPVIIADQAGLREASDGLNSVVVTRVGDSAHVAAAIEMLMAHWPRWRRDAAADSELVRARHAPARYRDRLVRVLDATACLCWERRA